MRKDHGTLAHLFAGLCDLGFTQSPMIRSSFELSWKTANDLAERGGRLIICILQT